MRKYRVGIPQVFFVKELMKARYHQGFLASVFYLVNDSNKN